MVGGQQERRVGWLSDGIALRHLVGVRRLDLVVQVADEVGEADEHADERIPVDLPSGRKASVQPGLAVLPISVSSTEQ